MSQLKFNYQESQDSFPSLSGYTRTHYSKSKALALLLLKQQLFLNICGNVKFKILSSSTSFLSFFLSYKKETDVTGFFQSQRSREKRHCTQTRRHALVTTVVSATENWKVILVLRTCNSHVCQSRCVIKTTKSSLILLVERLCVSS